MSTLETALRGGAVAILLLSLVLRLRYVRVSPVIGYSALLLLGVAAFVVDSAPGFYRLASVLEDSDPRAELRHACGVLDHGGSAVR